MERSLRSLQREELTLLEELARRRADDPLLTFSPHAKQAAFIEAVLGQRGTRPGLSVPSQDENWLIAANRAGKSDAGAFCGAMLARFGDLGPDVPWVGAAGSAVQVRDRATNGWVSALDFPTSRDIIQPKYFDNGFVPPGTTHPPFIPTREIEEWRVSDQILKLKNGSIIGFKSVETGRLKYQGAEKDWVHMDEEHPEDIYNEISIRVGGRRLRKIGTATLLPPVGQVGGVSWMFGKIIQPYLDGTLRNIGLYGASIYDNPAIPISEIEKLEALYPEGSTERRIRLNGEWLPGLAGARAYPAFQRLLNVRLQPEIVPRRPIAWMWDFNVEPMVSLIGQRERLASGKTLFRLHRELVIESGAAISEMVDLFYQAHPRHQAEVWIFGDATSRGRSRQTGKSDYTLILNAMRQYGVPVLLKVPESNPPIPDRINAVNRVCRDEDAEIRLEVDPRCVETIADMEQVLRDARGGIKKVYNLKDPYAKRTHFSDALGYWIHYEEPVQLIGRESTTQSVVMKQPVYGRR